MTDPLEASDRLAAASFAGLQDQLLQTFKNWASVCGYAVEDWKIAPSGNLLNPVGVECSFYEATCSLQRIAEMLQMDPVTLVGSFYAANHQEDQILPCQLSLEGHPSIVIHARWDGEHYTGPAPYDAKRGEPSVLVSLEGCGPELGKWTDPKKLYALMEYGFRLGHFVEHTDAKIERDDPDQDIPF